ncbi:hypothetical protein DYB37_013345 [Aphanomyces astaci]|uniref:Uncharacterized protein n=1 Tax=Aphanomyces astaci TaxID=112090 RepID=A0A3R7AN25_APHAT|nr:hypothetical protein DYB37_013345 [Aphanomyces astaci]
MYLERSSSHPLGASKASNTTATVVEDWFHGQLLDHKGTKHTDVVWSQRYFSNSQYYGGPGYPVFFYISGESPASSSAVTSSGMFHVELARTFRAILVTLEHRYYGKSVPSDDLTTDSLEFLTSEQAIGDIVRFQPFFNAKLNVTRPNWVAFGGSYPGMLAAWTQLQHPTAFAGVVASSAPVHATYNLVAYSQAVSDGLRRYGNDTCVTVVRSAMAEVHRLLSSQDERDSARFRDLFNPCHAITTDDDRSVMESLVYDMFASTAQANNDDVGGGVAGLTLAGMCAAFRSNDGAVPVQLVATLFNRTVAKAKCVDARYHTRFAPFHDVNVSTSNMFRQWGYQLCAEFGFGQSTTTTHKTPMTTSTSSSTSSSSAFSPLEFITVDRTFGRMCKEAYNISNVPKRVDMTNAKYGGVGVLNAVQNVVFSSGSMDPWSPVVVTNATTKRNNSTSSTVVDIQDAAHCRDLYARRSGDSSHVVWAHNLIEAAVDNFLKSKPCQ